MDVNIDLGSKGPEIAPAQTTTADKYYPSIYIDRDTPLDLPESGQMTVTFKVRRRSEQKSDGKEGEIKHYSYELEIRSIDGVEKGEESVNSKKTPTDELDARIKKHLADKLANANEE